MGEHRCATCGIEVIKKPGRGVAPKYCDEHRPYRRTYTAGTSKARYDANVEALRERSLAYYYRNRDQVLAKAALKRGPAKPRVYTRKTIPCEVCGTPFRPDRYKGLSKRTCSRTCGLFIHSKRILATPLDWRQCRCGEWFIANSIKRHCAPAPKPSIPHCCRTCGCAIPMRVRLCDACRKRNNRVNRNRAENARRRRLRDAGLYPNSSHRARARRFGVEYMPILPRTIFERDRWRCQLCGRKVLRSKKAPHPRSPSLDHIMPMSLGGPHLPTNVHCACLGCNTDKGIEARNEQMRLV